MPRHVKRQRTPAEFSSRVRKISQIPKDAISQLYRSLIDQQYLLQWTILLLVFEMVVLYVAITYRPYTEIDWSTYMQQVKLFLAGERFYPNITGDTGPCVYPAGYLYAYSSFYWLTEQGASITKGQVIFALLYLWNILVVSAIYKKGSNVPPFALVMVCGTSYRLHSIFVLRLFNDALVITLLHSAVLLLLYRRHLLATIVYSLSLSVKMNVLLLLPAWGAVLCIQAGYAFAALHALVIVLCQVLLGLPFLLTHPHAYLAQAFNLRRHFLFKWTVNWRFLPPALFDDPRFHASLLAAHVTVLLAFAFWAWTRYVWMGHFLFKWDFLPLPPLRRPRLHASLLVALVTVLLAVAFWAWTRPKHSFFSLLTAKGKKPIDFLLKPKAQLDPKSIFHMLLTCNLIGVMFSRTLHYQFYAWYYYSLPVLLWATPYSIPFRLLIWGCLELCWNTYPSTVLSSAALHVCHLTMLVGLVWARGVQPGAASGHVKGQRTVLMPMKFD